MFGLPQTHAAKAFKQFDALTGIDQLVNQVLPAYGARTAIRYDDGETYRAMSFDAYRTNALRMVHLLRQDRRAEQKVIATFTKNRPEWDMTALASLYTGHVLFPLDTKMNAVELRHLLSLNPPDYVLVSRAQLERMADLLGELGQGPILLLADAFETFEDRDASGLGEDDGYDGLVSLGEWLDQPAPDAAACPPADLTDELVLAHYATSGTTSLPKVVRITHGNIVAEVNEGVDVLNLRANEEVLNIGPYTHIATLVEFLVTKTRGFPVTYFTREPEDDGVLEAEIRKLKRLKVRIKGLMAVPKFWIHVLKETLEELKDKPTMRGLYEHLIAIEKHAGLVDLGGLDKAKLTAVRMTLREKLGGYFSFGISSSAKIDGAVVEIFGKLGITVLDIYGATEASGIISRNRLDDVRPGTSGRLIDALRYRVANPQAIPGIEQPVGELWIKGPTVTAGYLGQPRGAHLDAEGWFATGDLAWVDEDRVVHLVGRRKELLRWDDGSYVDPMHLSNLLVRSIFVKDALVTRLAPEDQALSLFLFPDYKRVEADARWRAERATGIDADLALRHRLEEAVTYAQSIARVTPRLGTEKIYLLPRPLERTPTHKIKVLFELQRLDTSRYV